MDERVLRAMAQWPNVPDVYGWVSLTSRGQWRLRDAAISNPNLIAFINRNYARHGAAYAFQNGPQRVWVNLEYLPWVLHRDDEGRWRRHTGAAAAAITSVHLDDHGRLILTDGDGPGLVRDEDLPGLLTEFSDADGRAFSDAELEAQLQDLMLGHAGTLHLRIADRCLPVAPLRADAAPRHFGFEPRPQPPR